MFCKEYKHALALCNYSQTSTAGAVWMCCTERIHKLCLVDIRARLSAAASSREALPQRPSQGICPRAKPEPPSMPRPFLSPLRHRKSLSTVAHPGPSNKSCSFQPLGKLPGPRVVVTAWPDQIRLRIRGRIEFESGILFWKTGSFPYYLVKATFFHEKWGG